MHLVLRGNVFEHGIGVRYFERVARLIRFDKHFFYHTVFNQHAVAP
ncbi:Uncharacterised protein [Vibrio cholerae]|nr:Uncharacterised protein [Vibrio cholerae]